MDLFTKCPYKYQIKYVDGHYPESTAIHLDLGTLCHKVCELKGRWKIEGKEIDYDLLNQILVEGCEEETDKGSEDIIGADEIRRKYFESWYTPDNKSGKTYEEKIKLFSEKVIKDRMEDEEWKVLATELRFSFIYDERIILQGFIDRVDINQDGDLRVVDYKTSKKVYDSGDIKTPLQMVVYALACYFIYDKIPIQYIYDFILIDEIQEACTKGFLARGIGVLNRILDKIDNCGENKVYTPKPSPLCYYCPFSKNNPDADSKTKFLCEYFSLWSPNNKVYSKNKEFGDDKGDEKPKIRKLVF